MPTPVTDAFEFLRLVEPLVGTWAGTGHGDYPTIGAFDYRETLELAVRPAEETLRYEQRTLRLTAMGAVPSHWEVDLVWLTRDGDLRLSNAQNGRSEAMSGRAVEEDGMLVLELRSTVFGLDDRMVAAARTIRLSCDVIEYEQRMATTTVTEETMHLRNRLTREA